MVQRAAETDVQKAAKLLTAKLVDDLEIALDNWANGEGYIYRLAVDSLRHKPSLIVKAGCWGWETAAG